MKKIILPVLKAVFAFLFFTLISVTLHSQTLSFCEDVDEDGNPVETGTSFIINQDGGYIYFYCNLGHEVNCTQIHYTIYSLDDYGTEHYENIIYQDVETSWAYFWKKISFYHTGDYNVYVYDDKYNLLAQGTVRIKM